MRPASRLLESMGERTSQRQALTWTYRFIGLLCFVGYWAAYAKLIPLRLPITGLGLVALALSLPNIAPIAFVGCYPILLYLNQYPQHDFSSATFLVIALVLGLSFRRSARMWAPLGIAIFYFCISLVRYRPDASSLVLGMWTTNQGSPALFVGMCLMWIAGIMLFDFFRTMKSSSLYYALLTQGVVFAAMTVGNIWLRKKSVFEYQFLFGDVHAFAAYLVLQIGLLAGLWRRSTNLVLRGATCGLLVIYSLLLVASYSRSGLLAYVAMIVVYVAFISGRNTVTRLFSPHFYRQNWGKAGATVLVAIGLTAAFTHYRPILLREATSVYQKLEPMTPITVKRELGPRFSELKKVFLMRIQLITPDIVYTERVRNWVVPFAMIRDYPVFGIGVGAFYRSSVKYAQTAPPDLYFKYPENAHNYYLQIAAETGVVGLAIFLAFLVHLLWENWRSTDFTKAGSGISLLGLIVFSVAQHPLLVDRVFFMFVTVCSVLAARERDDELSV